MTETTTPRSIFFAGQITLPEQMATAPAQHGQKIILDLCGGTGSWSEPYRKAGYDVRVITWPQYNVTQYTAYGTDIEFLRIDSPNLYVPNRFPIAAVHGILAAPPCTQFSRARQTAKTPRDYEGAMRTVRACLEIVWLCRAKGNLQFWALENPMGQLRQFLGNPPHSFRGWEYGDHHMKFTDLWGYYRMPAKKRGAAAPGTFDKTRWASPRKPAKYAHLKLSRGDIRAITPPGFAAAFYKANP